MYHKPYLLLLKDIHDITGRAFRRKIVNISSLKSYSPRNTGKLIQNVYKTVLYTIKHGEFDPIGQG